MKKFLLNSSYHQSYQDSSILQGLVSQLKAKNKQRRNNNTRDKELQKTYNVSKDVATYLDHAHKVMPIRKAHKKYYTFEQHKKTVFKNRPST